MRCRFHIHRQKKPARKIFFYNYTLIFLALSAVLGGTIFLLTFNDLALLQWLTSSAVSVFFFCLFCLLVSSVLSYYVLRELFRLLEQLSGATRKIARGDYSVRLESSSIIAEIDDMTQNFNLMAEELGSVEMLRKNFIADVSHEFKTPLSSITGYITLLQDPDLSPAEREEYTRMAVFNAEKLNDLTENILRLSRLENQNSLPAPVSFRLDEQIREAIVMLEPKWSAQEILLDIDMPKLMYCGQRELLLQVWLNLISNAIKFSVRGGQVRIHLYQAADSIHAVIQDWGIGMDLETQSHIFEKFYQGDTSRRSQGNGLGLALTREIVHRCGGEILVSSHPGEGSTFTVILPHQ